MKIPLWPKTSTQVTTEKTVDDLKETRLLLAEQIRLLQVAVSDAAQGGLKTNADRN